jgi:DNA polymerase
LDRWDDFVRIEIASALKQDKLVIPVLVGQSLMPTPDELPEDIAALARRNAVELSHQRFTYDVSRLIRAIEGGPARKSPKSPATGETISQKETALKAVRDDLVNATSSPLYAFRNENRYFPVLGEGNPDANLLFIGESPGKAEAAQGKPFCGPSGEVLDEMLRSIGLKREDVYVTNILLDRPPENRDPTPEELAFYGPFVDRIIDIIQPAVIVPLGGFAMQHVLKRLNLPEKRGKIGELHGKLIKTQMPYGEIHVVPLYHPAVVLYEASKKNTLRQDFLKLKLFV